MAAGKRFKASWRSVSLWNGVKVCFTQLKLRCSTKKSFFSKIAQFMHRGILWSVMRYWRTQVLHASNPQQWNGTGLCVDALKGSAQMEQSAMALLPNKN
jgi:hypothetical protein